LQFGCHCHKDTRPGLFLLESDAGISEVALFSMAISTLSTSSVMPACRFTPIDHALIASV